MLDICSWLCRIVNMVMGRWDVEHGMVQQPGLALVLCIFVLPATAACIASIACSPVPMPVKPPSSSHSLYCWWWVLGYTASSGESSCTLLYCMWCHIYIEASQVNNCHHIHWTNHRLLANQSPNRLSVIISGILCAQTTGECGLSLMVWIRSWWTNTRHGWLWVIGVFSNIPSLTCITCHH